MQAAKTDKATGESLGTGRRKKAVARVRIKAGTGQISINGRPFDQYFPHEKDRRAVLDPLMAAGKRDSVDLSIRVTGGGSTGQSGACKMGIARALVGFDGETFATMRDGHFLTRDSRMKERKHYGLRGARRGVQFSKR